MTATVMVIFCILHRSYNGSYFNIISKDKEITTATVECYCVISYQIMCLLAVTNLLNHK